MGRIPWRPRVVWMVLILQYIGQSLRESQAEYEKKSKPICSRGPVITISSLDVSIAVSQEGKLAFEP